MTNYIILLVAIILEIALRLFPTKFNLSIIDNVKSVMLQLHSLIEIVLPNKRIENE